MSINTNIIGGMSWLQQAQQALQDEKLKPLKREPKGPLSDLGPINTTPSVAGDAFEAFSGQKRGAAELFVRYEKVAGPSMTSKPEWFDAGPARYYE